MGCSNSYYGTAIKGDYFTKALYESSKERRLMRMQRKEMKMEEERIKEQELKEKEIKECMLLVYNSIILLIK